MRIFNFSGPRRAHSTRRLLPEPAGLVFRELHRSGPGQGGIHVVGLQQQGRETVRFPGSGGHGLFGRVESEGQSSRGRQ